MSIFMMMSREMKRVPLDFDWAVGKVWKGYKRSCGDDECEGCDACKSIDPPTGEGFQLWETVSEGSPISPVFKSKEELCQWLAKNKREHDICNHLTYDDWMKALADPCPVMDIHTNKLHLSDGAGSL